MDWSTNGEVLLRAEISTFRSWFVNCITFVETCEVKYCYSNMYVPKTLNA